MQIQKKIPISNTTSRIFKKENRTGIKRNPKNLEKEYTKKQETKWHHSKLNMMMKQCLHNSADFPTQNSVPS